MPTLTIKPGQSIPWIGSDTTVLFHAGVTYPNLPPVSGGGKNIRIGKAGTGPNPKLQFAGDGITFGGVFGLTIEDIDLKMVGKINPASKGTVAGIEVGAQDASDITIRNVGVESFEWNISFHDRAFDADAFALDPPSTWIQRVKLERVRSLDAKSPKLFGGQCIYVHGVNGLVITDSVFDCAGYFGDATKPPTVYSHNLYLAYHTRGVELYRNYIGRGGMYGAQCRGAGLVKDNIFNDCATACLLNGPNPAAFKRNVVIAGHWTNMGGGQKGAEWCSPAGELMDNLYIPGPKPASTKGLDLGPPWKIHNRPNQQGWEWRGKVGAIQSGNIVATKSVKLTQAEIDSARSGRTSAAELMASVKGQAGA